MLNYSNSLNIIATILVKNESDIIKENIEHHLKQGVKRFIVTDNGSSDSTKDILSKYTEVVEIIDEKEDDHNQSKWVTRMARLACKFNPDWIIHLDADELWCGLGSLKNIKDKYLSSNRMYLHPPSDEFSIFNNRYYLDFDHIKDLPGECKVIHKPDPNITITHGNHGFEKAPSVKFIDTVWRHHYPIRSYEQLVRKSVLGHAALSKRNSICQRWKRWNDMYQNGTLKDEYKNICNTWKKMIANPNKQDFIDLLSFWSESDVVQFFKSNDLLPEIRKYPLIFQEHSHSTNLHKI